MSKFCRLLRWSSRGHLISRSARVYGEDRVVERWPATHTQVSWEHINKLTPIFVRNLHDLSMEYGSITIYQEWWNTAIVNKNLNTSKHSILLPSQTTIWKDTLSTIWCLAKRQKKGFSLSRKKKKVFKRNCFFSFLLNVMKEDRWFAHLTSKLLLLSYIDSVL